VINIIYTTYFAKLKKLPDGILPIAICAQPPASLKIPVYRALAPKYNFFQQWKITKDNELFTENYIGQVLNILNPVKVVTDLYYQYGLAPCSCDIALVCYEKSSDFCHRHLVAEWLRANGYQCKEFRE
jgi:hypothetical protein